MIRIQDTVVFPEFKYSAFGISEFQSRSVEARNPEKFEETVAAVEKR